MNLSKLKQYSYDVAMDTLWIVLGHSGHAKRSPFVDLMYLRKYSPDIMDVSVAIDGIEYWIKIAYKYHCSLIEVDHACMVYDSCVCGHVLYHKGLMTDVGR